MVFKDISTVCQRPNIKQPMQYITCIQGNVLNDHSFLYERHMSTVKCDWNGTPIATSATATTGTITTSSSSSSTNDDDDNNNNKNNYYY